MNKNSKPNFDIINKNKVAIKSLRIQLSKADSIEELTDLAAEIVELETQIAFEKSAGYKLYQAEKKKIANKIDKLNRCVNRNKSLIELIDSKIEYKTSKKELSQNIDEIQEIYKEGLLKIKKHK
jgi:hypothetical protein